MKSPRLVTRVTTEQMDIFSETARACGIDESQLLRYAINSYMADIVPRVLESRKWPRDYVQHGGKREGAGRPPKNGGTDQT